MDGCWWVVAGGGRKQIISGNCEIRLTCHNARLSVEPGKLGIVNLGKSGPATLVRVADEGALVGVGVLLDVVDGRGELDAGHVEVCR